VQDKEESVPRSALEPQNPKWLKFATTYGEIDLSGQDQEIVVGQTSLSVPPGIHQFSQGETVPGFVLFEGGQGLVGREEGGGHVDGSYVARWGLG
jgi:hypothetical protein